jgi:hypothetical protein
LENTVPESIFAMEYLHTLRIARNPKVVVPLNKIAESTHIRYLDISQTATVNFDGLDEAADTFAYLVADGLDLGGNLPSQILSLNGLKVRDSSQIDRRSRLAFMIFILTYLFSTTSLF